MSIIDTHSHIFDEQFDLDINQVIERAKNKNVEYILLPNIDESTIDRLNNLCDLYPNYVLPMMGLHPTSVTTNWKNQLSNIKSEFSNKQFFAVGEIGIDLYWDRSLEKEQKLAFEEQLRWSIEFNLPVSIHSRNATLEAIESIQIVGKEKLRGVFHSFSGTEEELSKVLNLNHFLIGINGTITYKKSNLPEILINSGTDLSRIVIETDAPYLPPVPFRGKRNEPAYTSLIVDKLAEIYKTSTAEVEKITTKNAKKMFNI